MLLHISVFIVVFASFSMLPVSESDNYNEDRNKIMKLEQSKLMGSKINLTEKEMLVDHIILKMKQTEISEYYQNVSNFLPARHFFYAKNEIMQSSVFSFIKEIPKGGSLHTHFLAGVSIDYIIKNITYKPNIYGGFINDTFKLKFFENGNPNISTVWKKLEEYRDNDKNFDDWLKQQMSLNVADPDTEYPTALSIWTKFKKTFTTQYDMVSYRPVFEEYIYQLLKELHMDNVMYTELRGTFMPLYELNGTIYDIEGFFKIFKEAVDKFKEDHPDFIGVGYIHNLYRGVSIEDLRKDFINLLKVKSKYPDFICGFDFVGYEEEGHQLYDFHEVLLEFQDRLKFYFHAGETNWFGHTDNNLIDAVLLNSSRIGHGFSLNKHPILLEIIKERNICIELCPISNQVLKLIQDLRNHPATNLIANGYPVVICNDDPAVWDATGLSFDWYEVFMAMTPENAGLKVLKQFAINSITYSAMNKENKLKSLQLWEKKWERFLDGVLLAYK